MVKQGKFSVSIVHADTKIPFPEHTAPNGEIYVEVEPDSEYYIQVSSDSEDKVRASINVDGKNLGYYFTLDKHDPLPPKDRGLWKFENGKSYDYALKFAKASVRNPTSGDGTSAPFWTGKIEVEFCETQVIGYYEQQDYTNEWKGGDVSFVMGISDPDKKKGVKSDQGSSFAVQKAKRRRANYSKGGVLKTITMRYCSTLGLIHANILPKPPMWDMHRLSFAAESQENVPQPSATVKGENGAKAEVFELS